MQHLQLWARDSLYKKIMLAEPKLASWNANADPGQIAVQRYLDDIEHELDPLPKDSGLFLHMEIDVKNREHLLHHHDLDNYLYPAVQRLGASRFRLVGAIKRIGGGSSLQIGVTKSSNVFHEHEGWIAFLHDTGGISVEKSEWKRGIRDALQTQQILPLKFGAVELQLIYKCSSRRSWSSLWKPTIDAMGPILGEPNPHRPFYPNDDRIVSLALHLNTGDSIGWSVQIGMMWRSSFTSL
jgi:hypothetical protein